MKSSTWKIALGLALVLASVATPAFAQITNQDAIGTPEVGIGTLGSAMTLLSGGYLVLSSKLRRKK